MPERKGNQKRLRRFLRWIGWIALLGLPVWLPIWFYLFAYFPLISLVDLIEYIFLWFCFFYPLLIPWLCIVVFLLWKKVGKNALLFLVAAAWTVLSIHIWLSAFIGALEMEDWSLGYTYSWIDWFFDSLYNIHPSLATIVFWLFSPFTSFWIWIFSITQILARARAKKGGDHRTNARA